MLTSGSCRATLRRLGTAAAVIDKLERRNLRLLCVCLLAFACVANEGEAWLLCLLGREAVASAMLPDIALVTSHAVTAVVEIFAVNTTHRAVERPLAFLFLELLKFLLVLLLLRQALSLRNALSICGCIALCALRDSTLRVIFESGQLFFVEDALRLSFAQPLFSGKSARFVALLTVSSHT